MTYPEHFKKNWILAYPVMLSQVGHMIVGLADSVMVGRLGAVPLASVALANSVFTVMLLLGIGISYGMTPLVASSDGANDKQKVASVLKHGLLLNGTVGLILVFILLGAADAFVYLNQKPEVLEGAIPYFLILSISMFPLMFFQTFRQFLEGLSLTKQAMFISIFGNLINVMLNYVLIFGEFGIEPMGVLGAGWATFFSRVLMAILMGSFVLFHKRFKKYMMVMRRVSFEIKGFVEILKIGFPSGLQYVFEIGAFTTATIMIGWLGAVELAAHQIALNLSAITYMMATGISAAGTIRIGNQLGQMDYVTMRQVGVSSFIMVAIMMMVLALLLIVSRNFLPTLYIEDTEVIQLAASLLVIASLFQISDGIQSVGLGVLRGLSDVKVPTLVTLFAYWVVAIPLGYFLGIRLEWGTQGVWLGLLVGLTVSAVMHLVRFNGLTKEMINNATQ